jgi:hypothetical protein
MQASLSFLSVINNHIAAGAAGCLATLASGLAIYLLGVAFTPRVNWKSPNVAFLGATILVLSAWYAVNIDISQHASISFLILFAGTLAILRAVLNFRGQNLLTVRSKVLAPLFEYVVYYAVAYIMLLPSADPGHLPVVFYGNNDIFSYTNYSAYLDRLGETNIENYNYLQSAYLQTPGVFCFINLVSIFFSREPLLAVLPVMLGVMALIGVVVSTLIRDIFKIERTRSALLACLLLTGCFFQYICRMYFLSQVMASAVLLMLLLQTVRHEREKEKIWKSAGVYSIYYLLLFFLYPSFLVIAVVVQVVYSLLFVIFNCLDTGGFSSFERIVKLLASNVGVWFIRFLFIGIALLVIAPFHFFIATQHVAALSQDKSNGWILDMVSPFSIIAFPGAMVLSAAETKFWMLVAVFGLALLLVLFRFRIGDHLRSNAEQRSIAMLAFVAIIAYYLLYTLLGPSYKQWKFASYFPLLLSFSLLPFALIGFGTKASSETLNVSPEKGGGWIALVSLILIIGNFVENYIFVLPAKMEFTSKYWDLRSLDSLVSAKTLYVRMNSYPETFLPVYFIRRKVIRLISESYFPISPFKEELITPETPLFSAGSACVAAGAIELRDLGCLYDRAPALALDRRYPFSDEYSFIAGKMYTAEPWGRWAGKLADLQIFTTPEALNADDTLFLNLELSPYLPPTRPAQSAIFHWGKNKLASVKLADRATISLPVSKSDWDVGIRAKLAVRIECPDAVAPKNVDKTSQDPRELSIGFIALSMSSRPAGILLQ